MAWHDDNWEREHYPEIWRSKHKTSVERFVKLARNVGQYPVGWILPASTFPDVERLVAIGAVEYTDGNYKLGRGKLAAGGKLSDEIRKQWSSIRGIAPTGTIDREYYQ